MLNFIVTASGVALAAILPTDYWHVYGSFHQNGFKIYDVNIALTFDAESQVDIA